MTEEEEMGNSLYSNNNGLGVTNIGREGQEIRGFMLRRSGHGYGRLGLLDHPADHLDLPVDHLDLPVDRPADPEIR